MEKNMYETIKLVQTKGSEMTDILIQGGYMLFCFGVEEIKNFSTSSLITR